MNSPIFEGPITCFVCQADRLCQDCVTLTINCIINFVITATFSRHWTSFQPAKNDLRENQNSLGMRLGFMNFNEVLLSTHAQSATLANRSGEVERALQRKHKGPRSNPEIFFGLICNWTIARWRHFTTTTRILEFVVFLCKLRLLFFNPQRDWQI